MVSEWLSNVYSSQNKAVMKSGDTTLRNMQHLGTDEKVRSNCCNISHKIIYENNNYLNLDAYS